MAAGVACFSATFLAAAHRFFVAAMIRACPCVLRRRFCLAGFMGAGTGAGVVAAALSVQPPTVSSARQPCASARRGVELRPGRVGTPDIGRALLMAGGPLPRGRATPRNAKVAAAARKGPREAAKLIFHESRVSLITAVSARVARWARVVIA
jgi:hypothetical protein